MAAEQGATLLGVGRDCRLTSDAYAEALIDGINRSGVDVIDIGMCPTPLLYFSLYQKAVEQRFQDWLSKDLRERHSVEVFN